VLVDGCNPRAELLYLPVVFRADEFIDDESDNFRKVARNYGRGETASKTLQERGKSLFVSFFAPRE
jgi:hypothetical protein